MNDHFAKCAIAVSTVGALAGCTIVGGEDVIDQRNGSKLFAVWNENGTHFFTDCRSDKSTWRRVSAPPRDALVTKIASGPMSKANYRSADFFVCPELEEVSK